MALSNPRYKILPLRGTYTALNAEVANITEGEICYATDEDQYYQKEGGVLVSVGATKAQGALADSAVQPGDNISTLTNDAGYITSAGVPGTTDDLAEGTTNLYSQWDNVTGGINYAGGNVGIGTTTPGEALDINGTAKIGNTKLYSSGSGGTFDLRFQTYSGGFFDRVTITGAGNVGIGTTTPGRTLDVSGSIRSGGSTNPYVALNDGTAEAYFEISGSQTRISSGASQPLAFRTGSDERMRIDSAGNVGIGTSSPNKPLHIYTGSSDAEIRLQTNSGTEQNSYITLRQGSGDLDFYTVASGTSMKFHTVNAEAMRIDASGNVGIGTSSPQDNLQVGADSTAHIAIANSGSTDVTSGINWRFGSAGTTYSKILSAASGAGATYLSFYTSNAEAMRIDASGNVGIGTTSPSVPLHVVTTGNNGIRVNAGTSSANQIYLGNTGGESAVGTLSSNSFSIITNGSQRLHCDHLGNVGIAESAPEAPLHVGAADSWIDIGAQSGNRTKIGFDSNNSYFGNSSSSGQFIWTVSNTRAASPWSSGTERMRIDSSGRLLVGSSSSVAPDGTNNPALQVNRSQSSALNASILIREEEASTSFPRLILNKNRGNNPMQTDNTLGAVDFYGDDGSSEEIGARIQAAAAGNWSTTSCPTDVFFSTTASGATSPSERMRIDSSGRLLVGTTVAGNAGANGITIGDGTTAAGLSIRSGTSSTGNIYFSDGTSGEANYRGYVQYNHVADALILGSASSDRLRIDSSGRVGMGVSSPATRLHVGGVTQPIIRIQDTSNTYGLELGDNTTESFVSTADAKPLSFYTSNLRRIFIDASGNVGIATIPDAWEAGSYTALHIGKGGAIYGRAAGDEDRNGFVSNCYHTSTGWKYIASSAHATRYDQNDGNHTWYSAGTGTADASVSFSETMRVESNGHVYINSPNTQNFENGIALYPDGKVAAYTNNTVTGSDQRIYVYDGSTASYKSSLNSDGGAFFAGSVGIGTSTPGNFDSQANQFVISSGGSCGLTIDATSTTSSRIHFADGAQGSESYRGIIEYAHNTDSLHFSTAASTAASLDSSGNFTATANVTAYSDIRLKTDIEPITNALDKVEQINGVTYTRVDIGERQTGLIAQEVEKVLPEAVMDGEEYKSVAYGNLAGLLVEAIKELREEVKELKAEIKSLKEERS